MLTDPCRNILTDTAERYKDQVEKLQGQLATANRDSEENIDSGAMCQEHLKKQHKSKIFQPQSREPSDPGIESIVEERDAQFHRKVNKSADLASNKSKTTSSFQAVPESDKIAENGDQDQTEMQNLSSAFDESCILADERHNENVSTDKNLLSHQHVEDTLCIASLGNLLGDMDTEDRVPETAITESQEYTDQIAYSDQIVDNLTVQAISRATVTIPQNQQGTERDATCSDGQNNSKDNCLSSSWLKQIGMAYSTDCLEARVHSSHSYQNSGPDGESSAGAKIEFPNTASVQTKSTPKNSVEPQESVYTAALRSQKNSLSQLKQRAQISRQKSQLGQKSGQHGQHGQKTSSGSIQTSEKVNKRNTPSASKSQPQRASIPKTGKSVSLCDKPKTDSIKTKTAQSADKAFKQTVISTPALSDNKTRSLASNITKDDGTRMQLNVPEDSNTPSSSHRKTCHYLGLDDLANLGESERDQMQSSPTLSRIVNRIDSFNRKQDWSQKKKDCLQQTDHGTSLQLGPDEYHKDEQILKHGHNESKDCSRKSDASHFLENDQTLLSNRNTINTIADDTENIQHLATEPVADPVIQLEASISPDSVVLENKIMRAQSEKHVDDKNAAEELRELKACLDR